ncbi:DNA-3-methyladenine glycosylase [Luteolibacter sp. LG18]|uniref:DNA-3-methyladenine glycosylase n=1 Tax=Luteolibacter sp. LG18 TaxID=2819286 RepID=UPI002B283A48|nr:putative 3-methyladenine DNA glycosylase [Luteolibacter sp. LG18]
MERIGPEFFQRHPVACARELIGCLFHWHGCAGRIVETEAYAAEGDPACHTFFRPGARRFVASHEAGDAYVYLNYGVHWLFNILVRGGGMDGFVLLRALEPVAGLEAMRERRPDVRDVDLCAGPGKLTKALGIDGGHHAAAFLDDPQCLIIRNSAKSVMEGPRIGISTAVDLPWRFGLAGSVSLSRKF